MTDALAPIEVIIDLDASPDRVWRAITTPDELARWWAAGDIAAVVGHSFDLDMGAFGSQPCEILEVAPERLLRFRFTPDWELEWRLEPTASGTQLTMVHSGFDAESPRDAFAHQHMGEGWRTTVLPALAAHLAD